MGISSSGSRPNVGYLGEAGFSGGVGHSSKVEKDSGSCLTERHCSLVDSSNLVEKI